MTIDFELSKFSLTEYFVKWMFWVILEVLETSFVWLETHAQSYDTPASFPMSLFNTEFFVALMYSEKVSILCNY